MASLAPDQAVLPLEPARAARLLLWTIAALTASLLIWAAWAKIDEVAVAHGRVIPSRQLQVVSNLEGGVVQAILVRPGERVRAGQTLVQLDATQFSGELGKSAEAYRALQARSARLDAEMHGGAPVFGAAADGTALRYAEAERALFVARRSEREAAIAAEAAKLEQARRALGQAEVEASTRDQGARAADREVAMIGPLVEKGVEPQIELIRAETAQATARGAASAAGLAVRRARAGVEEAAAGERAVRDRYRSQAMADLASTRAEMSAQGEILPALRDRSRRAALLAPVAGTVNRVMVATLGGSVRPGEPLVELVPDDDTLVVEARVRPADIGFVHIGQRAAVKLTAYDYSVYGSLDGHVERVSPDATVDEHTGESYFTIRVRTDRAFVVAPDHARLPIGAGMLADVDVIGHPRSVLSYLLTPVSKLRDNAFREK